MSQIVIKDLPNGPARDKLITLGEYGDRLAKQQGLRLSGTATILYGLAWYLKQLEERIEKLEQNETQP